MVKVRWEKVVEYDMPETLFKDAVTWEKSIKARLKGLPAQAGSRWTGVLDGNASRKETPPLQTALASRMANKDDDDPKSLSGGGKAMAPIIGEYKITLVSEESIAKQMNTYYEILDILNTDKQVTSFNPTTEIVQETGDVEDAVERAIHYVLYSRQKTIAIKKIVGIGMGFISPKYLHLKKEMKNIPGMLSKRYIEILKELEGVEGDKLLKYVKKKYPEIEKYMDKGPQKLASPIEFYPVGKGLPMTHFGYILDDEPCELDIESCIRLIRHDKKAYERLHQLKPGGPLHPADEGGKFYFTISNDPFINITKSTSRYWEQRSCERAWCVGGSAHQGCYDDVAQGNMNLLVCAGHKPPKGWPDNQNKNAPSNPPKEGEVLGRLTIRWGWREGDKNKGIGIGPDNNFYGMRGIAHLKDVQNNLIMALMQIAKHYGLADYKLLGFTGADSKGKSYTYRGSADAGNMTSGRLTYPGKGEIKEGVAINFDMAAAQAPDIQYGALNRVSRRHIDIEVRRALARNTSIWAVEGGEACIARLIESNDQEIHRLIAGNPIAHSEAIYAIAQTMYKVFPDLEGAWMNDNTIDNIILRNPKCNQETRDFIQKNHKGYKRPAGRVWDEKKQASVNKFAKITPFEIITFGLGSVALNQEINGLGRGYAPMRSYKPNPFTLESLTSRKIGHILSKLNVVKREHPIVVGYDYSYNEDNEYKNVINHKKSVLYNYLLATNSFSTTNNTEIQMIYEYIILMHLLYCPNLTNKQFCTILLKIQEMFKTCHVNSKRCALSSTSVNYLPFSLLKIALDVYVTPRYSINDWGMNTDGKGWFAQSEQLKSLDSGTGSYKVSTSSAFNTRTLQGVMKKWNQTFKNAPKFYTEDGTILLKEERQSPESAKLIFTLMKYVFTGAQWSKQSTINNRLSIVEFLISLTRSKEVYNSLWRYRNKLNISAKMFTYNCLNTGGIRKEGNRFFDDKILLEAFQEAGGSGNERWLKYHMSGDMQLMVKMKIRNKDYIPDEIYNTIYDNEEYFIKYGIDEAKLETEEDLQSYCDKILSISLGKLYTESKATVDDLSKLNKTKKVSELYSATEFIHILQYAGIRLSNEPNLPIKYQNMLLEDWQSVSDRYGGDYEVSLPKIRNNLVNNNEDLSPEIIIKLYNQGFNKNKIAMHPNTPIEIITELFDLMPEVILSNPRLPMNIYSKLFNLTLSILRSPVGEDKNRLLHVFKNSTVLNQKGQLKPNINTMQKILRADRKSVNRRADIKRFLESHKYLKYWRGGNNKSGVFRTVASQNLYTEGLLDYIIMPSNPEFWIVQMADEHDPEKLNGTTVQYIHSFKKLDDGKYEIKRDVHSNLPIVVTNKSSDKYEYYNNQIIANPNFIINQLQNETLIFDDIKDFFGWIPEGERDKRFKEAPKWKHDNIFMFEDSEYRELEKQKKYPDWRYSWTKAKTQKLVDTFVLRKGGKQILKLADSWAVPYSIRGKPPVGATVGNVLGTLSIANISQALTNNGLWTPTLIDYFLPHLQHLFGGNQNLRTWINGINNKMGQGSFFNKGLFTDELQKVLLCESQKELNDMGLPMVQIAQLDYICYDLLTQLWQQGLSGEFVCKIEKALKSPKSERNVNGYAAHCINQVNAIVQAWVAQPDNEVYKIPYKEYLKCVKQK